MSQVELKPMSLEAWVNRVLIDSKLDESKKLKIELVIIDIGQLNHARLDDLY